MRIVIIQRSSAHPSATCINTKETGFSACLSAVLL
nr:MAG TPA: hypothetical protein [Herelleviridae sp.]